MTPLWAYAIGCSVEQQGRVRRVWEMQDHEEDCRLAREALGRGDLASAQQAGAELALRDPVPGLPPNALSALDAVRAGGTALSQARDLQEAANRLVGITVSCADCHRAQSVTVPALVDDGDELLWTGIVFESDASWAAGVGKVADPGALGAATAWSERRTALARRLAP